MALKVELGTSLGVWLPRGEATPTRSMGNARVG